MAGRGGKREGAGRMPKALELKAAEKLRAILDDETVIEALAVKVQSGDMRAIELWIAYILGKPTDKLDITSGGKKINIPISTWVSDED
jgi:hypothetical protein